LHYGSKATERSSLGGQANLVTLARERIGCLPGQSTLVALPTLGTYIRFRRVRGCPIVAQPRSKVVQEHPAPPSANEAKPRLLNTYFAPPVQAIVSISMIPRPEDAAWIISAGAAKHWQTGASTRTLQRSRHSGKPDAQHA